MSIESRFDVGFIARLTSDEKQIQQSYRPVIGVHKWFARRPGSLFRGLLLAEFGPDCPLAQSYFESHDLGDVTICDPFMGGGTTLVEANRIGCRTIGVDINPVAVWIVRQELGLLDIPAFRAEANAIASELEPRVVDMYTTKCVACGASAGVKYFLWVKQQTCAACHRDFDLFPGYLVAGNERHTHNVLHCPCCATLIEIESLPGQDERVRCPRCSMRFVWSRGTARRNRYYCPCGHVGRYPAELRELGPPRHRLFGIEYHCQSCLPAHRGRWFKTPDDDDRRRCEAQLIDVSRGTLPCPDDPIPDGDETRRLHRWGYRKYREMFNPRQLLALGLLAERIQGVRDSEVRAALATVFSDMIRYQNMLCRYDTFALKCQDIFAVHGFPVGLLQCENNVLGLPGVGGGGFRHFVEKYARAKEYCDNPFETVRTAGRPKKTLRIPGERIAGEFVHRPSALRSGRQTWTSTTSFEKVRLKSGSLDAVFTDPPYFNNVQYAELIDFCYAWLRLLVGAGASDFRAATTRSMGELTGNRTLGRDLTHFTHGLSRVFSAASRALKPGAPFVFTYHHNEVNAYVPIVVSILDAGLDCTATLPAPAEMSASLHINGTGSSILDSVIVCRKTRTPGAELRVGESTLRGWLKSDMTRLLEGGMKCSRGDLMCLATGHLARVAIRALRGGWETQATIELRIAKARMELESLVKRCSLARVVEGLCVEGSGAVCTPTHELAQARLFDQLVNRRDCTRGSRARTTSAPSGGPRRA